MSRPHQSMLYRRRLRPPYRKIRLLQPTVFIQFRYPRYAGHQVLFQDPVCTVPVLEIGDPVGGVRDPFTRKIVATQDTDADRASWGGELVGLEEGSGRLEIDFDAIGHSNDFRDQVIGWAGRLEEELGGSSPDLIRINSSSSSMRYRVDYSSGDVLRFRVRNNDGSSQSAVAPSSTDSPSAGERFAFVAASDTSRDEIAIRLATSTRTDDLPSGDIQDADPTAIYTDQHSVRAWAIWDAQKPPSTLDKIAQTLDRIAQ